MASVFIAVPQYKRIPDAEVLRLRDALKLEGWSPSLKGFHPMFDISIVNLFQANHHKMGLFQCRGDGNLPRVRAYQMAIWKQKYDSGEKFDYLMIVDEDISFDPDAIDILIKDDKPIVGGIYTFKTQDEFYTGKCCTRFLGEVVGNMLVGNQFGDMDGPFQVRWLNGGFILIKAEVIFAMIEKYPELEFALDDPDNLDVKKSWALWCPFVHERTFLSEDWAFCQRAREAGFDIWADWRVKLWHWSGEDGYSITFPKGE